jgi:hypothetical protein
MELGTHTSEVGNVHAAVVGPLSSYVCYKCTFRWQGIEVRELQYTVLLLHWQNPTVPVYGTWYVPYCAKVITKYAPFIMGLIAAMLPCMQPEFCVAVVGNYLFMCTLCAPSSNSHKCTLC